jgi:DNA recombination protein RmuC
MQIDMLVLVVFAMLLVLVVLAGAVLLRVSGLARLREEEARGAIRDAAELRTRLEGLTTQVAHVERDVRQDLANTRAEQGHAATGLRTEVAGALGRFRDATQQQLTDMATLQQRQLASFGADLAKLTQTNEQRLDAMRVTVEQRLDAMRVDNTAKLEQMRATVDEKLHATLEQRLGESFKIVSDRLEQVHRGLGEMQSLATGVGDLKRVLANVKTRGMWGEVQLAALLSEVLTPQQYAANVETVPGSGQRVEFAIRLPGRGSDGVPCWLPVDAKFPLEEWQRLQDALERADLAAADAARKALADHLRGEAKTIRASYIASPHTTDFAILFVPTEGLYAEMMARAGFAQALQHDYRVVLVGPTNFLALLNSLQMGFRTVAIEQRSSEVWRVLGAVKTEFAKFGEVIAKAKEKLDQASKTLDQTGVRSRAISRQLRDVEAMPDDDAQRLLGSPLLLDGDDGQVEDSK